MKICIVQTKSSKGIISKNIGTHLEYIKRAVETNADLIVFPELSITNYEPELAEQLATTKEDHIFDPFQELADKHSITIGVGMPTKETGGIHISMLVFQPNKERQVYSKQLLHADELPYFICGNTQTFLSIQGQKIALGICYETLQREHFVHAKQNGATIYIASVAKPKGGTEKAYSYFPKVANEFNTPILMANCVGPCDNFMSVGRSAVWNENGQLIGELDNENQGMLIYDTATGKVETNQLRIIKGKLLDLEQLFSLYQNAKSELDKNGIDQWTENYPTISIIETDLRKNCLFVLKKDEQIIGAISLSEEQESEYQTVNWFFDDTKVLVVHRLVVSPEHQKKGCATVLMDFAENYAIQNGYTSIRLDAYSRNKQVVQWYTNRDYHVRGSVYFPERKHPFYCMEKEMQ